MKVQNLPTDIPSGPHLPPIPRYRPHGKNWAQNRAPPTRRGCGPSKILPSLAPGKALYASASRQGRSFRGTPEGRPRQSRRLGRGPVFLEVARSGSFRSAAERLGLSINAVRRRIDDFERQTGSTLFTRDVHGAHLTDEGRHGGLRRRTHGGGVVRSVARQHCRRPTPCRAKSGSPSARASEPSGLPLASSNSSNRSPISLSICNARCDPPTYRGMRPTLRSISSGPPRSTSSSSGSAECI